MVALLAQKHPILVASQVEVMLEGSATPLPPGCRNVNDGSGTVVQVCWQDDANGAGLATAEALLNATVPQALLSPKKKRSSDVACLRERPGTRRRPTPLAACASSPNSFWTP